MSTFFFFAELLRELRTRFRSSVIFAEIFTQFCRFKIYDSNILKYFGVCGQVLFSFVTDTLSPL